ncbi:LAME_0G14356g1_1 [Lachancea meyersii CBS 8951]|uniref:LAME_0G14356g1_1 n=1 Tax=Lachancea meyersii CBS 8951 TaxID=1266667 RepID=A0A1G4KAJ3_9SACH|nr:LAME_0G14356g1_1 [Lachancea meyersii CBS 8951]
MLRYLTAARRFYSHVPATFYHPTIYAVSTSLGQKSAVAVVRITGTHSEHIFQQLTGSRKKPIARRASLRTLYDEVSGRKNVLDSSIVVYFAGPKSFTGEDMLELHLHGGKAVVKSVLKAIERLGNKKAGQEIRFALPGEFSQRAFQNGRMDLTELEGVGDLIDAETETQRRCAITSMTGLHKMIFERWRSIIVSNIAQLTAIIDFGDDAEINDIDHILQSCARETETLKEEVERFIHKIDRSSILQNGIKVALLGSPNAGKSSLLNRITSDETSIVSDIPGTTRDTIDVPLDIGGFKVVLCDTAGIRSASKDKIEIEGMKRARAKAAQSDLAILVVDATARSCVTPELSELVISELSEKEVITVINKTDAVDIETVAEVRQKLKNQFGDLAIIEEVSCLDYRGIDDLVDRLSRFFKKLSDLDADPIAASKRVQEILKKDVLYGINEFLATIDLGDVVMASENLASAAEGIGKITGESVGIEEVLGVVFSRFCVGK